MTRRYVCEQLLFEHGKKFPKVWTCSAHPGVLQVSVYAPQAPQAGCRLPEIPVLDLTLYMVIHQNSKAGAF